MWSKDQLLPPIRRMGKNIMCLIYLNLFYAGDHQSGGWYLAWLWIYSILRYVWWTNALFCLFASGGSGTGARPGHAGSGQGGDGQSEWEAHGGKHWIYLRVLLAKYINSDRLIQIDFHRDTSLECIFSFQCSAKWCWIRTWTPN